MVPGLVLQSLAFSGPSRVALDVTRWRDRLVVAVRREHSPANVGGVGKREERKPRIPPARPEAPRDLDQ